ncbi:scavenger receptor cysteine-rich type 1 protein M130-like [Thunnus maccoyii]|uniref:scavenger receptor cysteine-rich type 1 protein M130-like n=1 Tax=Thunnus maccoyii TaxID=8240 RepID=UPI001C4C04B3|nr:scavenger receptor cysteine-rich type 1 protein M130-like [Thunnus maccoyii]
MKNEEEWIPVYVLSSWSLYDTAAICRRLDCGYAISARKISTSSRKAMSLYLSDCVRSGSPLGKCATAVISSSVVEITCSDSVRLVNGTSLCSGRLEVKSNQLDQSNRTWSSVCEADFDQRDAEVVCRELGCGAPSVLQGSLYGEVDAPMWTKDFQCGGHESALQDCGKSDSTRNTCSSGKAVGLTCSEPVRLVGGGSRCAGMLEVKHQGDWKPVSYMDSRWTLKSAVEVCRQLDCGSALLMGIGEDSSNRTLWHMDTMCIRHGADLRDCVVKNSSFSDVMEITCSVTVSGCHWTELYSYQDNETLKSRDVDLFLEASNHQQMLFVFMTPGKK